MLWRTFSMKTYYIPTSSLNFNNILSSESISPKAFYQERAFGYSRWASIPENPYDNSIVLYDQLCSFVRPKSDYEDHPMVVEVVLEDVIIDAFTRLDEHTLLSDHTIYLDPFTTRIFFFSENEKWIALSLSDSSIETKFVRLYQKKILVIAPPAVSYQLPNSSKEVQSLNMVEIDRDKRINRMKGLLYGYYIGGLLSSSREDVIKLNSQREIQDTLAAVLASYDHKATPQQRARLKELYSGLQPEIPFFSKLSNIISEKSLFDAIVSLVRGEYGYIRGEFDVDRKISQLLSANPHKGKNPVIEEINLLIRQTEDAIARTVIPVSVMEGQIVVKDGSLLHINLPGLSDSDKVLYKEWINNVLSKDEYSGKISTFKEALSDDVTRKAKEVFEPDWKGSYPEITLNALRRHVRGDEFNHVWKEDIYSALSAVIIRGDDWQKLLQYMQDKVMTDYRLAFSMYGTINGFANLPRDFTDVLFNRDSKYIAEVYKEIYGQLFGRSVLVAPKADPVQGSTIQEVVEEDMPDFTKPTEVIDDLPEATSPAMLNEPAGFDILMRGIISKCAGAKKDERLYKELYIKFGGLTQGFVDAVRNEPAFNKGKGAQQGVRQFLLKSLKPQKESKPKKTQLSETQHSVPESSLFSDSYQSTGCFLTDYDFLTNNSEFVSIMTSAEKKWIEDLIWFIDAHKPDSLEKYYQGKPTDNKTVIIQFINLKKGIYSRTKDFLYRTYGING